MVHDEFLKTKTVHFCCQIQFKFTLYLYPGIAYTSHEKECTTLFNNGRTLQFKTTKIQAFNSLPCHAGSSYDSCHATTDSVHPIRRSGEDEDDRHNNRDAGNLTSKCGQCLENTKKAGGDNWTQGQKPRFQWECNIASVKIECSCLKTVRKTMPVL